MVYLAKQISNSSLSSTLELFLTYFFVGGICILKDGLVCLKQLSLFLQNKQSSVLDAMDHVDNLKHKLLALKQTNGKTRGTFFIQLRKGWPL